MCAMTSIRTVTVNAAFLQEIKEVHLDLWQTLKELDQLTAADFGEDRCVASFAGLLGRLRDQLALHFSLEEAYGYFDDPAESAPQLCQEADRLRSQHATLYLTISALTDTVEQVEYDGKRTDLSDMLNEYRSFRGALRRHEDAETELIQQAYGDDIGVGD